MMTGSVNKAIIMGALGRDPEIRPTRNGDEIANLSVATSEKWTDKRTGEKSEKTEWHRVTVFNPHLVRIIKAYVKKGSVVYLEGEVRTRKWTDQQGLERFTTEVVLTQFGGTMQIVSSPKRDDDREGSAPRQPARTDPRGNPQWDAPSGGGDDDSEIPF